MACSRRRPEGGRFLASDIHGRGGPMVIHYMTTWIDHRDGVLNSILQHPR